MLTTEYTKLLNHTGTFINIGISEEGKEWHVLGVPWERTGTAMNMKKPHIMLQKEDLYSQEILGLLGQKKCLGCYIFTELKDYSFLYQPLFQELLDLHIRRGKNLKQLDFLADMSSLHLLYLEEVEMAKLSELFVMKNQNDYRILNLALKNCIVHETDKVIRGSISELIIINDEYSQVELNRWKKVSAGCFRYRTIKET